jgi:diguanylate cyclase (GGDEF)-like protein
MARKQIGTSIFAGMGMAFDIMNRGCMLLDRRQCVAGFNRRLGEILGFAPGVMRVGASSRDLIQSSNEPGGHPGMTEVYRQIGAGVEPATPGSYLGAWPDGRTFRIGYSPSDEESWIVTFEDISPRIDAEQALAEHSQCFEAVLANLPHGVSMFDAQERLILWNARYVALYALPPELSVAGTPLQRILDHRVATGSAPIELTNYLQAGEEAEAIADARSVHEHLQDGRTIRITHSPVIGGGYVANHEDVTAAIRAEEKIHHMGSYDALTGLPNRSLLRGRIGVAAKRVRRGEMFAVHCLDLDNFRSVNNAHGHSAGDLLLRRVAKRLRRILRDEDTLCRVGADEFVVLQADIKGPEQVERLARRLVEAMAEPFDLERHQVHLGVSIGVAICPNDGADADALLSNASMGMKRAKSEGRDTVRFFDLSMDAGVRQRGQLEVDLRRAIANGEFELYYQPQVDARTEVVTGCEALLRWHHPSRGIVPPGEFIPVAEEIGIIVPLGAWVIQQACHDASRRPKAIGVAVNLSSRQFESLTLFETVIAALSASGLSPLQLELEITESILLKNNESTFSALRRLRAMGVRIAMDDFGTGYSSLSYLRSFPFDKVKIDRSFIRDIHSKRDCSAIVRAMAGLGSELGMTVTAEGVETRDQMRLVRDHGCDEAQGYFVSRPCPIGALQGFFRLNGAGGAPHWSQQDFDGSDLSDSAESGGPLGIVRGMDRGTAAPS